MIRRVMLPADPESADCSRQPPTGALMAHLRKWLWERSAFTLASCVLAGLIAGWFLPDTRDAVTALAFAQISMAVVVLIRESQSFAK